MGKITVTTKREHGIIANWHLSNNQILTAVKLSKADSCQTITNWQVSNYHKQRAVKNPQTDSCQTITSGELSHYHKLTDVKLSQIDSCRFPFSPKLCQIMILFLFYKQGNQFYFTSIAPVYDTEPHSAGHSSKTTISFCFMVSFQTSSWYVVSLAIAIHSAYNS